MSKIIQVVKMDESILRYFSQEMNFSNESLDYREVKLEEFKKELEKALNCDAATKEIVWIK